jgi:hypothetical protein
VLYITNKYKNKLPYLPPLAPPPLRHSYQLAIFPKVASSPQRIRQPHPHLYNTAPANITTVTITVAAILTEMQAWKSALITATYQALYICTKTKKPSSIL